MVATRILFALAFLIWLGSSIAGMTVLWSHEARPGLSAKSPQQWPADSELIHDQSRSLLLVWLHPHCPCSWASVAELQRLLTHLPDTVDCHVLLSLPADCREDFVETDLTRAVRRLSLVSVVIDHGQREANRFGVKTSGQTLLYGGNGDLLFAGGITPGRGHEGDSVGAAKLRALFQRGSAVSDSQTCSVFGCSLLSGAEKQVQVQ